jgi:hypothetical protein
LAVESNRLKDLLCLFYSTPGVGITFQVMAVARQSTGDHDAIGAVFECSQDMKDIHAPTAHNFDDLDRRRVLDTQATREVSSIVGAMAATECDDLRLEICHVLIQSWASKASSLIMI